MSPVKVQLPKFIIADLYKDCLVEIGTGSKERAKTGNDNFKAADYSLPATDNTAINDIHAIRYEGRNKKKIAVIVNYPSTYTIDGADRDFLTNVLKACNLSLDDIAIINKNGQQLVFSAIKQQLDAHKILLFDVEPSSINLPFSIPNFQVQGYAGCTILGAPALSILSQPREQSRLLKSQLWVSLKQMFGIA